MTFETFIRIVFGIFAAEDVVIWLRGTVLLRRASLRLGPRLAFHAFLAFQTASSVALFTIWFFHHAKMGDGVPKPFWVIIVVWHVVAAPVALAAAVAGVLGEGAASIAGFVWRLAPVFRIAPGEEKKREQKTGAGITRRQFLGAAVALAPPVLSLALSAAAFRQLSQFRVRYFSIALPQLPPELDGMTIAHVSDTHLGRFTHGRIVQDVVEATNALKPDLVIFTGDLIDNSLKWLPPGIKMLKAIEAPMAVCEGNHDLLDNALRFETLAKECGLPLLLDEAMSFKVRGVPVQVLGARWAGPSNWEHRGDERGLALSMESVLQLRDPFAFQILAAHHPHAWDYSDDIPLTLSGHTHGGQLMVNEQTGIGPMMFRYWSGLYTEHARGAVNRAAPQALVVSNGVGNWFPIRVSAPAEIVHITLRAGGVATAAPRPGRL